MSWTFTSSPGGALFLVFLVLKLTHVIGWSWWWVTAPLWGPLLLAIALFAVVLLVRKTLLKLLVKLVHKKLRLG